MPSQLYCKCGKRIFDILGATAGLILLSPVIAVVAAAIRVNLGSPVIFKHTRPGKQTETFDLYKFRTMTNDYDENGKLLPDGDRITRLGSFLRTTSLDEIPELVNILKGEMSFVGPRPLLSRYLPYYTVEELRRFDIRPGLTGLAQVNGRNAASWDSRLADDIWYVDNVSFSTDLKIMLKTLKLVWKRQGVVVVPGSAMLSLDEERKNVPRET